MTLHREARRAALAFVQTAHRTAAEVEAEPEDSVWDNVRPDTGWRRDKKKERQKKKRSRYKGGQKRGQMDKRRGVHAKDATAIHMDEREGNDGKKERGIR